MARGGQLAPDPGRVPRRLVVRPRAIDAVMREIGVDQLVYGSDRPVVGRPRRSRSATRCEPRCASATRPACSALEMAV